MLPITKIICPTDFSDPSYEGLKAANELTEHFSAELILVHVVSPTPTMVGAGAPTGFHIPAVIKEMEDEAAEMLEGIIAEKVAKGIKTRAVVIHGRPAHQIVGKAEEENADIIVIATHGQSGWQRLISGSVTERVVRMASTCPVLAVPAPPED
jgi:nucleotide-binding universal stress UspA family protein